MPTGFLSCAVDRDARGADLLAEDRQRVIGQRIDVGDVRIADRDVDEALVGAHVLRSCRPSPSPSPCAPGVAKAMLLLRLRRAGASASVATDVAASAALIQPRRNSAPLSRSVLLSECRRLAPATLFVSSYWLFTSASPPLLVVPKRLVHVAPFARSVRHQSCAGARARQRGRRARCRARPARCIRRSLGSLPGRVTPDR